MTVTIVHTAEVAVLAGKCWQALDRAGIVCDTQLNPLAELHLMVSGEPGEEMDRACKIVNRLVEEHNR